MMMLLRLCERYVDAGVLTERGSEDEEAVQNIHLQRAG